MKILFILFFLVSNAASMNKKTPLFKISIFHTLSIHGIDEYLQEAFEAINRRLTLKSYRLEYTSHGIQNGDSYKSIRELCGELEQGRLAIIGIGTSNTLDALKHISNSLGIPFILVQWSPIYYEDKLFKHTSVNMRLTRVLNLHPSSLHMNAAINDLISHLNWDQVTILFQESLGFSGIDDVINVPRLSDSSKLQISVRMLESDHTKWIYLLKDIKMRGNSHFVVHMESRYLNEFVAKARDVGLMTSYYHFIFTTLDLSLLTFAPPANITAFQLHRPNDPYLETIFTKNKRNSLTLLVYDALLLVINTIESKQGLEDVLFSVHSSVSCAKETVWLLGREMNELLLKANFTGLTGEVTFDELTGLRSNTLLYIVDMTKNGVELYGYWSQTIAKNNSKQIHVLRSYAREYNSLLEKLDRNLIVTTRLEDPYVMKKFTNKTRTKGDQNERYEGYCIELLERISKICDFNYSIRLVEDGLYGTQSADGTWNGLVRELMDKKADLAVAALTITYQREQAIDFTKPFLNLGISILLKRPTKRLPSLFSFLSPLTIDVWIYMIAAYLAVSFILYVLSRLCPHEWYNPHPCNSTTESETLENDFSLVNSLWWTISTLMQQGIELSPRGLSTRLVAAVWWFFALIMISSYTANLAAFQTAQRLTSTIEDVDSLSKQTEIKYGCLNGGSTQTFFKETKLHTYERMWKFMSSNTHVFVNTTEQGLTRVKDGGYAFLLESTMNEYARQRDCDLIQVGGLIDSKGYGIGTPAGSPWRNEITNAILKLQEDGTLQNLYSKWWKSKKGAIKCEAIDDKKKDSINELGVSNVGGVFLVLLFGLVVSILVAFVEFFWYSSKSNGTHDKLLIKNECKKALCTQVKVRKNMKNKRRHRQSETIETRLDDV